MDYEILRGQLANKIGRAVSEFVRETKTYEMQIQVAVDKPVAVFCEEGNFNGMTSIRVYISDYDEE